jgi:proline iminopeptidase
MKWFMGGYMPPYRDSNGEIVQNSVSELRKLALGGVEQWITIRGRNRDLPILVFFHGGPGSPQTGAQRKFLPFLEEHFLVINWDQRGSGKSYSSNISTNSMNLNQLLSDAFELIRYLVESYNKDKVYLMGHSVGAVLGLLFAKMHPQLIHAYIGVNQPIIREEEECRSYQYALEIATQKGNKKALNQLTKIGPPSNGEYSSFEKGLVTQRTWLTKFSGVTYKKNASFINLQYILSSHLTLGEKLNFMKGFGFSATHLWRELTSINFFDRVTSIEVPVYLIAGEHDRIVFADQVEKYYNLLEAPKKQFYLFRESGHFTFFEESKRFEQLILHDVLQYDTVVS